MKFRELLKKQVVIFDGAMGTMMQKLNLETGEIPELLNFTDPRGLSEIYRAYAKAGSHVVSANTFGSVEYKVEGCGYSVEEIITQAIAVAKEATASYGTLVAMDVGPCGKMMAPTGDLSFEEAYRVYKRQSVAAEAAGADLIIFETFADIYEMKAAILAAKENTQLPIVCSVTFQEDGRMLMGTDPLTMVTALQDLGIDALGVNCSLGPKQIAPIVTEVLHHCRLPVIVQPNAGLPRLEKGETVFDVTAEEYAQICAEFVRAGVRIIGGCCGTDPGYIRLLADKIKDIPITERHIAPVTAVCSSVKTVELGRRIAVIGEKINPTGKKKLKEALREGNLTYVEEEALRQEEAGAQILDINVGLADIDEKEMMLKVLERVSSMTPLPLQIDSAKPEVVEAAARYYNGKPLINSVNGKQENMEQILPVVAKYGACVVALALDEDGIPESWEKRVEIIGRIIDKAACYGIEKERIIADCLTLTVSAQQSGAKQTLRALREVKHRFGIKTTLGASNISFGLPERKLMNRTFLAAALQAGLDAPITDPTEPEYMDTIRAYEVLSGGDLDSQEYIDYFVNHASVQRIVTEKKQEKMPEGGPHNCATCDPLKKMEESYVFDLYDIIQRGFEEKAGFATEVLLEQGKTTGEIIEEIIVPALSAVGDQFEKGRIYLPQLIKSAETVKQAFQVIKRELESSGENINRGTVAIATVKGDVHDIGKNIARVMLENNGYEVIDLGKDVSIQTVCDTVTEKNIRLLGLSALMTTTVVSMEETIKAVKAVKPDCLIMVGGAVLTEGYAKKIGADFYCKDALDGVKISKEVFGC